LTGNAPIQVAVSNLDAVLGTDSNGLVFLKSLAIPGFHITWTSSDARISSDGQLAYLVGENAVTLPDPTGETVTLRGRAVTIWRREADGEWRCAVDIWNAHPG